LPASCIICLRALNQSFDPFITKNVNFIEQNVIYFKYYVIFVTQILIFCSMKKIIPLVVISILVLGTTLLWFMNSGSQLSRAESWQFVVILLIVAFAGYILYSRVKIVKRGEPAEDELSKKILQKASSFAYYLSLYLWVAMIVVNDRVKMDTEVLLGTGILGMAVIWVALVIFFKVRGLRNE